MTDEDIMLCGSVIQKASMERNQVENSAKKVEEIQIRMAMELGRIFNILFDEKEAKEACEKLQDVAIQKNKQILKRSRRMTEDTKKKERVMIEIVGWLLAKKLAMQREKTGTG